MSALEPGAEAVDLFAGAGGWDVAARELGIEPLGLEVDRDACSTRKAAGLATARANVAEADPADYAPCRLLIASPPCPSFSAAGKSKAADTDQIIAMIASGAPEPAEPWDDERSALTLEPLRWTLALEPELVALEQVPLVRPVWDAIADVLRARGYAAWVGVLNAADYGVPQIRHRAILLATRERASILPPEPTHLRWPNLLGLPTWQTMADALGWGMTERPYPTVVGSSGTPGRHAVGGTSSRATIAEAEAGGAWRVNTGLHWKKNGSRSDAQTFNAAAGPARTVDTKGRWHVEAEAESPHERPSTVIQADARVFPPGYRGRPEEYANGGKPPSQSEGALRVGPAEAAVLQGFPRDYPFRGGLGARHRQIGNAIPPPFARAILGVLVGSSAAVAA